MKLFHAIAQRTGQYLWKQLPCGNPHLLSGMSVPGVQETQVQGAVLFASACVGCTPQLLSAISQPQGRPLCWR